MDHSPKKSKALLITIIAVIVLLILGYFLFFRNNQIFGLKSSSGTGSSQSNAATDIKNFVALLFKPKAQQTTTDTSNTNNSSTGSNTLGNGTTTGNTNTGGNTTDTTGGFGSGGTLGAGGLGDNGTGVGTAGGFGAGTGDGSGAGFGTGSYGAPTLTPLPTPTGTGTSGQGGSSGSGFNTAPQCSDGIDNNANGLIDIKESGCHTDFNAKNITSYDPTINDESRLSPTQQTAVQTMCPSDDPLVFTDDEKAQLQSLLTQYYLIAPGLKNADDLALLSANITTDQTIIDQATTLTQQCMAQKANPNYTGPQYIKDNPYYQGGGNTSSYVGSITFVPSSNGTTTSTTAGSYTGDTADSCSKKYNAFQVSELVACIKAANAEQQAWNQQNANNNSTNPSTQPQPYSYFEDKFNIW